MNIDYKREHFLKYLKIKIKLVKNIFLPVNTLIPAKITMGSKIEL